MLLLMAREGSSISLWSTQVVNRLSAWAAELAWTVERVPECHVRRIRLCGVECCQTASDM
jgi:hypothetical protein